MIFQKKDTQIGKSLSTSSSSAQIILVHAGRNPISTRMETPVPRAGESPMQIETQSRVWQLVPCSRRADDGTPDCQKRKPKISGNEKDCHEKDGACSWASTRSSSPQRCQNMKEVSSYGWLEKLTKSTDKERYKICLDPSFPSSSALDKHLGPFFINSMQEHSAPNSTEFLLAENPETCFAKKLHHIGLTNVETHQARRALSEVTEDETQPTLRCQVHVREP